MKRGGLYMATLEPRSGSEQRGTRPVLLVSNNLFNATETWRSLIVLPLSTSARNARRGPTSVPVEAGIAGLKHDSFVLCHQVTTLDRAKLGRHLGDVPESVMADVAEGLRVALELD